MNDFTNRNRNLLAVSLTKRKHLFVFVARRSKCPPLLAPLHLYCLEPGREKRNSGHFQKTTAKILTFHFVVLGQGKKFGKLWTNADSFVVVVAGSRTSCSARGAETTGADLPVTPGRTVDHTRHWTTPQRHAEPPYSPTRYARTLLEGPIHTG